MSSTLSLLGLLLGVSASVALGAAAPQAVSAAQGGSAAPSNLLDTHGKDASTKPSSSHLSAPEEVSTKASQTAEVGDNSDGMSKAATEVQQLLSELRSKQERGELSLELPKKEEEMDGGIASGQTRRKLLQFGYDPQLLLDQVYILSEVQRLEFLVASAQAQLTYLQNLYNGIYQQTAAFAPGGAFNPAGRRLMANSELLRTNLVEAKTGIM